MVQGVVEFDRRAIDRSKKKPRSWHNPHALGIYLTRVDEVMADIQRGADPAQAVAQGFSGPLLRVVLKWTKLERRTGTTGNYKGLPVYKPVTPEPEEL
jgi:hypothetical protein